MTPADLAFLIYAVPMVMMLAFTWFAASERKRLTREKNDLIEQLGQARVELTRAVADIEKLRRVLEDDRRAKRRSPSEILEDEKRLKPITSQRQAAPPDQRQRRVNIQPVPGALRDPDTKLYLAECGVCRGTCTGHNNWIDGRPAEVYGTMVPGATWPVAEPVAEPIEPEKAAPEKEAKAAEPEAPSAYEEKVTYTPDPTPTPSPSPSYDSSPSSSYDSGGSSSYDSGSSSSYDSGSGSSGW